MLFFSHKKRKPNNSDYKHLLEVFAEMNIQSFSELDESSQKELIGAWMNDPRNEDDILNMIVDIANSEILSELMYGSISNEEAGKLITKVMLDSDHIKSINADIDEAFTDYILNINDDYEDETYRDKSIVQIVENKRMGM